MSDDKKKKRKRKKQKQQYQSKQSNKWTGGISKLSPSVFKQLGFHSDIPTEQYAISVDSSIKRYAKYERAILVGICEELSGGLSLGLPVDGVVQIQLPPDIVATDNLENGYATVTFSNNAITVTGLATAQNWTFI